MSRPRRVRVSRCSPAGPPGLRASGPPAAALAQRTLTPARPLSEADRSGIREIEPGLATHASSGDGIEREMHHGPRAPGASRAHEGKH